MPRKATSACSRFRVLPRRDPPPKRGSPARHGRSLSPRFAPPLYWCGLSLGPFVLGSCGLTRGWSPEGSPATVPKPNRRVQLASKEECLAPLTLGVYAPALPCLNESSTILQTLTTNFSHRDHATTSTSTNVAEALSSDRVLIVNATGAVPTTPSLSLTHSTGAMCRIYKTIASREIYIQVYM